MNLKNKTWFSLKFFDNEKIAIQNLLNVSMLYTCYFKINDFFIIIGYIHILLVQQIFNRICLFMMC